MIGYMVCCRIASPAKRLLVGCSSAAVLLSFFIYHVHYLTFVTFSYSYNMMANLTAGFNSCHVVFLAALSTTRLSKKSRPTFKRYNFLNF